MIHIEGGPVGGEGLDHAFSMVVALHHPPYMCLEVDGVWEHYVGETGEPERYVYAGPCQPGEHHFGHGDDHA